MLSSGEKCLGLGVGLREVFFGVDETRREDLVLRVGVGH